MAADVRPIDWPSRGEEGEFVPSKLSKCWWLTRIERGSWGKREFEAEVRQGPGVGWQANLGRRSNKTLAVECVVR